MDVSILEHSDSDSGESWTLLDNSPADADTPDLAEHPLNSSPEIAEKDEDTDGISIISDSDPESLTPCELSYDKCLLEETRPPDTQEPESLSVNPVPINIRDHHQESIRDEDFLGNNNGKHKTYVHKRNKRLSTMLNIIVLGSVITAAGVAIGHMWGVRHDCSFTATPSVNKILSNLYKLQEENAYLRNRIKELTLVNNFQMLQRKNTDSDKPVKLKKCKKVFEESLTNKDVDRLTKCVDDDRAEGGMMEFEKEFLSDIEKLKNVYQQNKSWLDDEIAKRMKREEHHINKVRVHNLKSPKSIRINEEVKNDKSKKGQTVTEPPLNSEKVINVTEPIVQLPTVEITTPQKISYADSLKSNHKVVKRDINQNISEKTKRRDNLKKKKLHRDYELISEHSSDEDLRKDDRYITHKFKPEPKKTDRQKQHKKQKRRNKYEQWEMKGGYMKDYDDVSITSLHENEQANSEKDKKLSKDLAKNVFQFAAPMVPRKPAKESGDLAGEKPTGKEVDWYESRAALRSAARRKLEQELLGTSANTAQWYFRRMQRREQCRGARDNSTYRRLSKRLMNYKIKH